MNEATLQIGDEETFIESFKKRNIVVEVKKYDNVIGNIYGLRIILNKNIPKDRAVMIDKNGVVLQVYNL
jgi:hypothetical protein